MTVNEPVFYSFEQSDRILEYIGELFGEPCQIAHQLKSEYVHVDVANIGDDGEDKVFVTFGAGAREMNSVLPDFQRTEFLMSASKDLNEGAANRRRSLIVCAELQCIGVYPFRCNTWIGPGHTINASETFADEFGYQYFLFAECADAVFLKGLGNVHFLNAIPVYVDERGWMATHENGSWRFLTALIESYDDSDDWFAIDIPRKHIIPEDDYNLAG